MLTKKASRVLCTILVCLLIMSLFSACGTSGTGNKTTDSEKTSEQKVESNSADGGNLSQSERTKIIFAWWVTGPVDDNSIIEQELEKIFTDIDFVAWPFERASYADQFNTRVAGGDIPDLFLSTNNYAMITQGVAAGFDIDMIKNYAPNYYKAVLAYNEEFNCQTFAVSYFDGKFYGMPLMEFTQVNPFSDGWRKDWLDKVGITKIPETLEEFEVAFKKFRNEDPDGNGVKDTYAFTGRGKDFTGYMWQSFFLAHGAAPMNWKVVKDGKLVDASTMDEYRDTLRLLNRWYKEELIDPEFITTDDAVMKQKIANNKIGYITDATWYRIIPGGMDGTSSEYYDVVKEIGGDLVLAPAPKGPNGNHGYTGWGPTPGNMIMFGKHMEKEQEKFKKVLSTLDRILSDPDIFLLTAYGIEGEHWERDEKTGLINHTENYKTVEQRKGLGSNFWANIKFLQLPDIGRKYVMRQDLDWNTINSITSSCTVQYKVSSGITLPAASKEEVRKYADISASLTPLKQKWFFDFVTGEKSVENDWDEWINEWKAAGGEEYINYLNEKYEKEKIVISAVEALLK